MDMVERQNFLHFLLWSLYWSWPGSSAKLQRRVRMAASTSPISSIILLPAPVILYLPPWKPRSYSTLLAAALRTSGWLSLTSPSFWILDGKHRTPHLKHKLQAQQLPSSTLSSNLPMASFKVVCYCILDSLQAVKLFQGIAGAFGATIVYPIDMGKWPQSLRVTFLIWMPPSLLHSQDSVNPLTLFRCN